VLYVFVSLCLVFSLLCGVGNALEQNELIVSVVLTSQDAYPGNNIIASIYLKNNFTEILTIQYVGIQFDWMASDQFLGYDLTNNPIVIVPSEDQFVDSINIILPETVELGEHTYFVGIDGIQGLADPFSWDSQAFILLIQDPAKQEYDVLLTQVSGNITASEGKNYQSSKAQSLLGQAEDAYDQALVYGTQNSWDEAVSLLNNALTYFKQANVEEQKYLADKSSQETLLLIVGVAVVAIVAISVIIYFIKKNKTPKQQLSDSGQGEV
jgi:hypothetical protein